MTSELHLASTIVSKWRRHVDALEPTLEAILYDLNELMDTRNGVDSTSSDILVTEIGSMASRMINAGSSLMSFCESRQPKSLSPETLGRLKIYKTRDQAKTLSRIGQQGQAADHLGGALKNYLTLAKSHNPRSFWSISDSPQDYSEIQQYHEQLNNLLDHLDTTQKSVHAERAYLRKRLNRSSSAISVLPPEIISYILRFLPISIRSYGQSDSFMHWYAEQVKLPSPFEPMVVSHVSTLFRDVALSTPTLWTHIGTLGGPPSRALEKAVEWLPRSKEVSIPILRLTIPSDDLTKLVMLHIHRVIRLEIQCSTDGIVKILDELAMHDNGDLRLDCLKVGHWANASPMDHAVYDFPNETHHETLGSLSTLILAGFGPWRSWPGWGIRYLKIGGGMVLGDTWKIFESSFIHPLEYLEELELWSQKFEDDHELPAFTFNLPTLFWLKVDLPSRPLAELFPILYAPNLFGFNLTLHSSEIYDLRPIETFLSTVQLRTLTLKTGFGPAMLDNLVSLLRVLPLLDTLNLTGWSNGYSRQLGDILRCMPCLTSLELRSCRISLPNFQSLVEDISHGKPNIVLWCVRMLVFQENDVDHTLSHIYPTFDLQNWVRSLIPNSVWIN